MPQHAGAQPNELGCSFFDSPSPTQVIMENKASRVFKTPKIPERARHWTVTVFGDQVEQDRWIQRVMTAVQNNMCPFTKILVGGWELSTNGAKHCHVLVEFKNTRKMHQVRAGLLLQDVKAWITPKLASTALNEVVEHHIKERSKIGPRITFQHPPGWVKMTNGTIHETMAPGAARAREPFVNAPIQGVYTKDAGTSTADEPPKKKQKTDMHRMLALAEAGDFDTIKEENPGLWLLNAARIQVHNKKQAPLDDVRQLEHYWIHGATGTGKTLSVQLLFPDAFQWDSESKYWDGFHGQKQVVLSDLDNRSLRSLGINRLKTMCDPGGFPVNIKYAGGQLAKAQIVVTSNFTIDECFKYKGKNANFNQDWYSDIDLEAVKRRFKEMSVHQWLFTNNIRLKSPDERSRIVQGDYTLPDLFEPHQLDRMYNVEGSRCDQAMTKLSTQLHATNQMLTQDGYIERNPFPQMDFDYCESSENVQVWRSSKNNVTLKITRIPDMEGDGADGIHVDMHPRTPECSDEENEPDVHPDYVIN
jgi:hypothetical protein